MKCEKCGKECRENSEGLLYEYYGECTGAAVFGKHSCRENR